MKINFLRAKLKNKSDRRLHDEEEAIISIFEPKSKNRSWSRKNLIKCTNRLIFYVCHGTNTTKFIMGNYVATMTIIPSTMYSLSLRPLGECDHLGKERSNRYRPCTTGLDISIFGRGFIISFQDFTEIHLSLFRRRFMNFPMPACILDFRLFWSRLWWLHDHSRKAAWLLIIISTEFINKIDHTIVSWHINTCNYKFLWY